MAPGKAALIRSSVTTRTKDGPGLEKIQINNNMNPKRITDSNYYFYCGRICFARRIMKQGRIYFIKSILSNPFKIINLLYLIFSILPKPILDLIVNTWKALKVKLRIQI